MFNSQIFFRTVFLILAITAPGCTTLTGGNNPNVATGEHPANETLLKAADNQAGLIELYKERLASATGDQEKTRARLQLAHTYLAMGDPESTLFILKPLFSNGQINSEGWLLKSKALLALGQPEQALQAVQTAKNLTPGNADTLNQLGLVYAEQGNYKAARESINQARDLMLDDLTVKNNLAMLDILEQDYNSAIKRLMPLYTSGQADDRIKANLVVALVRAGLYNEFKTVYAGAKSEQEKMALFIALSRKVNSERNG